MLALSESCPRLRTVSLSGASGPPKFTGTGLIALSRGCPDLTQLDLDRNHTIGDAAILSLAERCHKLQSVTLFANGLLTSCMRATGVRSGHHIDYINWRETYQRLCQSVTHARSPPVENSYLRGLPELD